MTPIWISIPTQLKWPSTIPGLTKSIRKLPLLANQHYRRSVIGELNVSSWALRLPGHRWDHISMVQRSEEHTSELQSRGHLVCRLLLEKNKVPFSVAARGA